MKKIMCLFIVSILMFNLVGCGKNSQYIKILEENGYTNLNDCKIEKVIEMTDGSNGLGRIVFALLHANNRYAFCLIDETNRDVIDIAFEYTPLNIVQDYIWSINNLKMNANCFDIAYDYIFKYGEKCFEDKEIAEKYLIEISGTNGVIDTELAQTAIINSLTKIIPKINTYTQSDVIFQEGTANPLYYAGKTMQTKYRWTGMFPESVYKVWEASVDTSTKKSQKLCMGNHIH